MPNQIEKILAEYMEKFGKKLNEQESRTGDELFMWLKEKFTQLQTEERQMPKNKPLVKGLIDTVAFINKYGHWLVSMQEQSDKAQKEAKEWLKTPEGKEYLKTFKN